MTSNYGFQSFYSPPEKLEYHNDMFLMKNSHAYLAYKHNLCFKGKFELLIGSTPIISFDQFVIVRQQ